MNEVAQAAVDASYKLERVFLSYVIAVTGAFVALYVLQDIRRGSGRIRWLNAWAAGAALGGVGVWSMHFMGMLALDLDMGSGYALIETLVSLVAAVVATTMALAYVAKNPDSNARIAVAGVLLGLGVGVMHYLGMYGMRYPGFIIWSIPTIALSVLIAIAAGTAALWMGFRLKTFQWHCVAALVMGAAVCTMHYVGMSAADFVCTAPTEQRFATPTGLWTISAMELPMVIGASALLVTAYIACEQMVQRSMEKSSRA